MKIRLAAIDDLPQLKAMYGKIIEHMNKNNIKIWDECYPYEVFSDDIDKKQLYVLTENSDIIAAFALCDSMDGEGFAGWKDQQAKALYINRLGVNVDYARRGIGSAALKEAMAIAGEKGAGYLRLFVVDNNEPAINLYKRNGFQKLNETYDEVIDEELTLHEYAFEIKLDKQCV